MNFASRLLRWISRRRLRLEIEDELRLHLQMRTDEYERAGLERKAAERRARRRFGSINDKLAECCAVHRLPHPATERSTFMESVWQDLRYAVRSLARQRSFAIMSILTLAVGISANAVIFGAVNSTLLRPFPFDGGDRIVYISNKSPQGAMRFAPSSMAVHAWRERAASLEGIATYGGQDFVVDLSGEPERLRAASVSVHLLPFLGVQPLLGRIFVPQDTVPGNDRVGLLTEAAECFINGEVDEAKALLRDYINATIGFQELGRITNKKPASLMRMLSKKGNPRADNLARLLGSLRQHEGVELHVQAGR